MGPRRGLHDADYGWIMNLYRRGSGDKRTQRTSDLLQPVQVGRRQGNLTEMGFDPVHIASKAYITLTCNEASDLGSDKPTLQAFKILVH